ncbi:MAG: type V CRISPR-associated endonuclease Cas1 [Lachnospiraceae bacterium]|nr:type V CRISPR-associated endonuclease Cas1 [Lachnospiraceae bacterium]
MIDQNDFHMKQMVFFMPVEGDKLSFKNDNIVVKDREDNIKFQITCYRVFILFVVGDTTITTGLLSRANKYGFSICLMNQSMKVYRFISPRMEGNTFLRKRQYDYSGMEIGQRIIMNKIVNQRKALMNIRNKNELMREAIEKLDGHIEKLSGETMDMYSILGIEGSASRVYFPQMFNNVKWNGRKPRIKADFVNSSLDVGYTILFNFVDAILNVYGFDEYYGVLHRCFYMRKSLVCDIIEPFRPIVDYTLRKAINLEQIKEDDFKVVNNKYLVEWKQSKKFTKVFMSELLDNKDDLFFYVQSYYRAFMKGKDFSEYPVYIYKG